MSWQSYADAIAADPNVDRAAILTRADGAFVASTAGFAPAGSEGASIAQGAAKDFSFGADGLHFAGLKYVAMRSIPINDDVTTVLAAQSGAPEGTKKQGLVLASTKTLLLLAGYDDSSDRAKTSGANMAVTKMAEYLAEQGM